MTTDMEQPVNRPAQPKLPSLNMQKQATRMSLFLVGYGFAVWAVLIPFIKLRTGLDEGGLGLLLLFIGIGSVGTMPITGGLVSKYSCRAVVMAAACVFCLALPLVGWLDSLPGLALSIFFIGGTMGAIEVAANIQGVYVQRKAGRALMSNFHAFYSVGSIVGAGFMTLCLSSGLTPFQTSLAAIAPVLLALLCFGPGLLGHIVSRSNQKTKFFAVPRGIVAGLGFLLMIMYICEGSVGNWGALLLAGFKGFNPQQAALGFAVFSVTIAIGRLLGDKITVLLGGSARTIIIASLATAFFYFVTVQLLPAKSVLVGYAFLGVAMAPLAPCVFTLAGKQSVMSTELAISAVTAFGYASALFSSPIIGMVARYTSLPTSLSLLSLLLLLVALGTFLLYRKPRSGGSASGNF